MIRPITKEDRDVYVSLADLFYHSEAVEHPVPPAYYERTFEELMRSEDYFIFPFSIWKLETDVRMNAFPKRPIVELWM